MLEKQSKTREHQACQVGLTDIVRVLRIRGLNIDNLWLWLKLRLRHHDGRVGRGSRDKVN